MVSAKRHEGIGLGHVIRTVLAGHQRETVLLSLRAPEENPGRRT
jgi:hypothetical protein